MAASITDDNVVAEDKAVRHEISDEEIRYGDSEKNEKLKTGISSAVPVDSDDDNSGQDNASDDVIIITGADAAAHLLPLRDDGEPSVTFRSLFLATCLSAFQAIMSQIYQVCITLHREMLFISTETKLTYNIVQTHGSNNFRNVYCPHRLLRRQCVGYVSSSR